MRHYNFIKETCTGTGSVMTLLGPVEGFLGFSTAAGEAAYIIVDADGQRKCSGTSYNFGGGTLEREDTWSTDGTTVDTNPSGNITLSSGVHTIYSAQSAEQLNEILNELQNLEFDVSLLDMNMSEATNYIAEIMGDYYRTTNIVGAVSESGGLPTGAIIESGFNSNGRYVKYADGTMICAGSGATSASEDSVWTFPALFATNPIGLSITSASSSISTVASYRNDATTSAISYSGVLVTTGARALFGVRMIAFGRWY